MRTEAFGMKFRHALLSAMLGVALAVPPAVPLFAQSTAATPSPAQLRMGPLTPVEQAFATRVTELLNRLYPTTDAAAKAGYARYTNEDRTGAISWINPKYYPSDESHPAQLWYDVNGRLLGADYSQLVATSPDAPTLFGLPAARFHKIGLHVHYVLKNPDGSIKYGNFIPADAFRAAGGDPEHPTAATLVAMGKAPAPDALPVVVAVPNNWDAQIWVVPNPDGQFADANPNVKPSPTQGGGTGEQRG